MTVLLNIEKVEKETIHPYLKESFGFPEYYGNNLDALYDCLTDLREVEIVISEKSKEVLLADEYGSGIWETMVEAAEENAGITITVPADSDAESNWTEEDLGEE